MDELSPVYLSDAPSRPVALSQLDLHPVAGTEADEVGTDAIGHVG